MFALLALALLAQAQPAVAREAPLPPAPAAAIDPSQTPSATSPAHDGETQPHELSTNAFPLGERTLLDAQMRSYFAGEKNEGWFWVGAGVSALAVGGGLSASQSNIANGASYPLLDISVVQFGAALYLFWRTGDQVSRLSDLLANHPCAFFAEEPARMKRVIRGFKIYLPVEATTLIGGAAMAGFGATGHHDFLQGAGWGLVAQSVVMLVFDQFAAARAETYERELRESAQQHISQCALP